MPLTWVDDPGAFASLEWAALVAADPEATLFHSPRFLKAYWEEFQSGRLHVAFLEEGSEPLGVAAFHVEDGTLTFLGGFDVTDYLGPVGLPEMAARVAKELMVALAARTDWDEADLRGLPEDGRWRSALREAAHDAGLHVTERPDAVAPFLPLPASFEDYLGSLPAKQRHEIRRKRRRLREAFPDARLVDATPGSLAEDLDVFVRLHRQSRGRKGRFMVPGVELFFRRLGDELLSDGTMRLTFLETGGRRIAAAMGFRWRDRFLLYNSAYDHEEAPLAPGMVIVEDLIRAAIDEGRRGFDFLTGDLAYKYRFGARPRRVARLLLRR